MSKLVKTLLILIVGTSAATAQRVPGNPAISVPRWDISAGYANIRANAPPGGCPCFDLHGGFLSSGVHLNDWFSIAGEFTMGRDSNISALGQDLKLATYMGGPRFSLPHHRLVPYAQALFGGAHASDSYFPTSTPGGSSSASSWAMSAGGGIDYSVNGRFAIRLPEAQYLRTNFNNLGNNQQNQLMLGVGLVIKFYGVHRERGIEAPTLPPPATATLDLTCTTNKVTVEQGKKLEVIGSATSNAARSDVEYTWTTTAGTIEGSGSHVRLNTDGVAPGTYRVAGHASVSSPNRASANCETIFRVYVKHAPPPPPAPAAPNRADEERRFHENVPDVLFDYDKWAIRPDGRENIAKATDYLKAHPAIAVLIGGYSDERGTTAYNLALGEKRANAVREALMAEGIDGSRITIISYGKGAQVCTANNEACYQQNRRAAFMMRP